MSADHLTDRLREARSAEDLDPLIAKIPYARFLGLSAELDGEELRVRMPFAERLIGDSSVPALHGGSVGALLESTAIFTVLRSTETDELPKTVTLTVDYLRSGRAEATWARARVTKRGRRIVIVHAEAWQGDVDKPIATANVHFLLKSVEPAAPPTST
ncbi:MAG: PaaI family thioesterase [Sandaracinaceae bacterium]|nr:PaaI family thioesterase [Sandaracinaceae bacterium]